MAREPFAAVVELDDLGAADRLRLVRAADDAFLFAGAGVGDVDGDGDDDLAVAGQFSGTGYVVFGAGDGLPDAVDLGALDGTDGFRLEGFHPYAIYQMAVAGAGDVDGDGLADILVGTGYADVGRRFYAGSTYVIFGSKDPRDARLDVATLDGTLGFRLDGDASDYAGRAVAAAGDLNGDGVDDIVVGAPGATTNGLFQAGRAYVVFGTDRGFPATVDLATLDGGAGFAIDGLRAHDRLGSALAPAGDVNGDGVDDLVLGTYGPRFGGEGFPTPTDGGRAFVIFGRTTGFPAGVDLAGLDGSDGFRLDGPEPDRYDSNYWFAGRSVAGAGDLDGDGFDDVVVGTASRPTYVVFGAADFDASVELDRLDGTDGFRFESARSGPETGRAIAGLGDVDGDGLDDLAIGTDLFGLGPTAIVLGRRTGFEAVMTAADLDGGDGFALAGFGERSVAAAGDVDDDGLADVLLAGGGRQDGYVVFGRPASATILGTDGRDVITTDGVGAGVVGGPTGNGADTVEGGRSSDRIAGGRGADVLHGEQGHDKLRGNLGDDILDGGAGHDRLVGGGGDDVLVGGLGDDVLLGQGGRDRLDGGAGIDTADWGAATVDLEVDLAAEAMRRAGENRVYEAVVAIENARTGSGDDVLRGGAGDNRLDGGAGDDLVIYQGFLAEYALTDRGGGVWDVARDGDTDTLVAIEQVQFADVVVDLCGPC